MVTSSIISLKEQNPYSANTHYEFDARTKDRFKDLLEACRSGDLEKVQSLVRNFSVPINASDEWQCSPLYCACLCGRYEVVSFLLENGARCERETFEGERCLYGALTPRIRELLLTYKFTKAVDESQSYRNVLTHFYENPLDHFSDIALKVRSSSFSMMTANSINYERLHSENIVEFYAHRFILCARCPYFTEILENTHYDNNNHQFSSDDRHHRVSFEILKAVDPTCFKAILRYIYTSEVVQIPEGLFIKMVDLCKLFELGNLLEKYTIQSAVSKLPTRQPDKELQQDIGAFFRDAILGNKRILSSDSNNSNGLSDNSKHSSKHQKPYHDMFLRVENTLYPCHRVMLSARSEYFNILINGPFAEGLSKTEEYGLPAIILSDCTCEILELILEFIYTDKCENIPPHLAYKLLIKADMLLFDRLKSLAAIVLTNQKEPTEDIYKLMKKAIDLEIDRLEQYCCRWFAEHLNDVLHDERFLNLIEESAHSIQDRQATDSIPFVDDLRYWLAKKHSVMQEDIDKASGKVEEEDATDWETEYNRRLAQIDAVLEKLNLDA
ncbi:10576_t:CDS:2 [Ambispora leptoticha]|uniref:10576_t:CDS:1 n=1 Tax=Ambispora leptoticha TaxID=144679 RepID=A0A9N9FJW4_9GLOM|nr:10576_t:CDS:2 [Ambispora leptoticha]